MAQHGRERQRRHQAQRFYLDHAYDRDRADPRSRSRYGNYLNQHTATFKEITGDYDDPSVPFAVAVWRIATGPIMSPPFVASPNRVHATLERSDWNGEAVIDAQLITALPESLRTARASIGGWYRGWPTSFNGYYETPDSRGLESGAYLLPTAQLLFQIPPGTLPAITEVPTSSDALFAQAIECLEATIRVLNREVGPLLEQLG